jgi:hypothetical protein
MSQTRGWRLPLLVPAVLPEFGDWSNAERELSREGLDASVLWQTAARRAQVRELVREWLDLLSPSSSETTARTQDPLARVQDDFFGVRRCATGDPAVFLLGFLSAHLDVLADAEMSGSGISRTDWAALWRGVGLLFSESPAGQPATSMPPSPRIGGGEAALIRWRIGHRLFFAVTQGLVSALARLARAAAEDDPAGVVLALRAATALTAGCAAALRFTADFHSARYEETVRPAMSPPHVQPGFSGEQGCDHQALVGLYRALATVFADLDPRRYPVSAFREATSDMFDAHLKVCSRFGGRRHPSLLMEARGHAAARSTAAHVLEGLSRNRRALLGD